MPASLLRNVEPLLKHSLADRLRTEIANGALAPGGRIVEGLWATRFGVAQASIREAINILAQEGFVTKQSGRSARVVDLSHRDVTRLYQLRGALEGLAASLAAAINPDLSPLQFAVDGMRAAAAAGHREALLDCDLQFHLQLCSAADSPVLLEHARRVLLPFFAFARMRVAASQQETSLWSKDLEAHQRIIDLIKEGEGEIARQYVNRAMERFAKTAHENWEKRGHAGR
jgi:DNA-binding GntR family transcriptional regulator